MDNSVNLAEDNDLKRRFDMIVSEILGYSNMFYGRYIEFISAPASDFSARDVVDCLAELRLIFGTSLAFERYIEENNITASSVEGKIPDDLAERCRSVADSVAEEEMSQRRILNSAQDIEDDDEYMRVCRSARAKIRECKTMSFGVEVLQDFADKLEDPPALMGAEAFSGFPSFADSSHINPDDAGQKFEYEDPEHQQFLYDQIISDISDINESCDTADNEAETVDPESAEQKDISGEYDAAADDLWTQAPVDSGDDPGETSADDHPEDPPEKSDAADTIPEQANNSVPDIPEPVQTVILNLCGEVIRCTDPAEAFVRICEYLIAVRPFMMSRMDRSGFVMPNGEAFFTRGGSISGKRLSNGLTAAAVSSISELEQIKKKLMEYCGIPENDVLIK